MNNIVQFSKDELTFIAKIISSLKFTVGQSNGMIIAENIIKKTAIILKPSDLGPKKLKDKVPKKGDPEKNK